MRWRGGNFRSCSAATAQGSRSRLTPSNVPGGRGWGGAALKRGEFAVPVAPPGTQPDLTGLSCRFEEIPSVRGLILAVLVVPMAAADPKAFRKLIEDLIALVERSPDA